MADTRQAAPKKHRGLKIALAAVLALLVLLATVFFLYTGIYSHADADVWQLAEGHAVNIEQRDGYITCTPQAGTPETGYIFYPGGKVEADAYLPYLAAVAQQGYYCVLLEVPFRLAILDMDAAQQPLADAPEIDNWAVGGHSLGGVAAAGFASSHPGEVQGLVLLASYPNSDLSQSGLAVLSVTASEDGVLDWQKYEDAKSDLPPDTEYVTIEGGNHGGFGMYGPQSGDGEATISQVEQCAQTADITAQFFASLQG